MDAQTQRLQRLLEQLLGLDGRPGSYYSSSRFKAWEGSADTTAAAATTTATAQRPCSRCGYLPLSRARALLLLLLLRRSPRGLRELAGELAGIGCGYSCARKAVSWLWERGVLKRVGRGLYAVSEHYLQVLMDAEVYLQRLAGVDVDTASTSSVSSSANASRMSRKRIECDAKVRNVTSMSLYRTESITNLTETGLSEKVKRFLKERFGNELGEVELLVAETLAKKREATRSWYIVDNERLGIGQQLLEWMERLGLCRRGSSSNSSRGGGGGRPCPPLMEVEQALARLADMDVVFVYRRGGAVKVRLSRWVAEAATQPVVARGDGA